MAKDTYGTVLPGVQEVRSPEGSAIVDQSTAIGLEALASGLKSVAGVWDDRARTKRQAAADARAEQELMWRAADRQEKQTDDLIQSDVTTSIVNLRNPGGPSAAELGTEVLNRSMMMEVPAADVTAAADRIKSFESAIEQGTIPAISRRARLDVEVNRLMAKYPGRAHVIAAQMKELGVQSELFDELQGEIDEVTAHQKADREWRTNMITKGREWTDPKIAATMSEDELAEVGARQTFSDNQLELQTKQASLLSAKGNEGRAAFNFTQQRLNEEWEMTASRQAFDVVNPIASRMQRLLLAMDGPGKDPRIEQEYTELLTGARLTVNNIVNKLVNQGGFATPEAASQFRTRMTSQLMDSLVTPYENRNKDYANAVDVFNKRLGFDHTVAAPVLSELRRYGLSLRDFPEVLNSLDPKILEGLQREMAGIAKPGLNVNRSTLRMMNVVSVFQGEKSLSQIDTPEERQDAVSSSWKHVVGTRGAVSAGAGNPDFFMNAARTLIVASDGFSPATPVATLTAASKALFDESTITAVNRLLSNPETAEEARTVGQGLRASAAVTLQAARTAIRGQNVGGNSPWVIGLTEDGRFAMAPNPKWKAPQTIGLVGKLGPADNSRPPMPREQRELVAVANRSLNALVGTKAWDPDAPKGSAIEVRRFWAKDIPTADMQKKRAAAPTVLEGIRSLRQDLEKAPDLIPEVSNFDSSNSDIIGPEGTGKNPRSSAVGVGQFTRGTWLSTIRKHAPEVAAGKSEEELLALRTSDSGLARQAVGWLRNDNAAYLRQQGLPATAATTALAHFAGAEGAANLLRASPDADVAAVLGSAAVNANPHLKGKTVAETLEWAERFYKA